MITVPLLVALGVTTPVVAFTLAIDGAVLDHVPPLGLPVNVTELPPIQALFGPLMDGVGFTLIVAVAVFVQPFNDAVTVYEVVGLVVGFTETGDPVVGVVPADQVKFAPEVAVAVNVTFCPLQTVLADDVTLTEGSL